MRTAKILLVVGLAVLLDSTPGSSWSLSGERPETRPCLPGPAISLLSSNAGLQIALISSGGCRR